MGRKEEGKRKISDYIGMGTMIGFGAAIGVVFGALLGNLVIWLCAGAAIGVVLGAIIEAAKKKKRGSD